MDTKDILDRIEKVLQKLNSRAKWILFAGVLTIIFFPLLVTHFSIIDFANEETASIGSSLGGITAPVIGIISALLIYVSFVAQIKANQIQITALMDTNNKLRAEKQTMEKEQELASIESQFQEINRIWLELLKGFNIGNSNYISYDSSKFIPYIVVGGRISIVNDFFLKINLFMEDIKRYERIHEGLKKKRIISQFAVLIGMSCNDFFIKIEKHLNPIQDIDLIKNNYTLGILSTITIVVEELKAEEYYYRDQDRILKILEGSIIVDY